MAFAGRDQGLSTLVTRAREVAKKGTFLDDLKQATKGAIIYNCKLTNDERVRGFVDAVALVARDFIWQVDLSCGTQSQALFIIDRDVFEQGIIQRWPDVVAAQVHLS